MFMATSFRVETRPQDQAPAKPRVSVGLPVFNGERYIGEALDALLSQTFTDFELIISDNASQDRTEEICRAYAVKDPRVRYFRSATNLGATQNYRRAFELSSGEYFKWQTYDDRCGPDFLQRCVEVLDSDSSIVLAYPMAKLIDGDGRVISEYKDRLDLSSSKPVERFRQVLEKLALCNALYGVIRADKLARTELLGNFIAGDAPLLAELALYGKFSEVPDFSFYRRFHERASTSYKRDEQVLEFYDPRTKYRPPFTRWKHFRRHSRSVKRAPIGLFDKIRLFAFLVRMAMWSRRELLSELLMGAHLLIRRSKSKPSV